MRLRVLAIDPGNIYSAWVVYERMPINQIMQFGKDENNRVLEVIAEQEDSVDYLVIEQIANMGMAVGYSVFETVFWSGLFAQKWMELGHDNFYRLKRIPVKMHLCGSARAKDANIRQALIDRFEPNLEPRKRPSGPCKGISKDVWQALAVAVTWADQFPEIKSVTNFHGEVQT